MYGILRRKEFLRHPCMCAPSQLVQRPFFFPCQGAYSVRFQWVAAQVQFLTRINPISMVRPTLGADIVVILPKPTRVSKAWPTTHAKKVIPNNPWTTTPPFPPR